VAAGCLAVLLAPPCLADPAIGSQAQAASAEPAVPEIRAGIELVAVALGGERFSGSFVAIEEGSLQLSTRQGPRAIPLPILTAVEIGGQSYAPEPFLEGVRQWSAALREQALSTPPPLLVGTLSLLWSGAGPAALGDWDGFVTWSLLEAALLGAGAVMVVNEQYGPLLPLAALDLMLHGWSAGESVGEARRRRRRAETVVSFAPVAGSLGDGSRGIGAALVVQFGGPPSAVGAAPADGGSDAEATP